MRNKEVFTKCSAVKNLIRNLVAVKYMYVHLQNLTWVNKHWVVRTSWPSTTTMLP
jgi:hypothetical protein